MKHWRSSIVVVGIFVALIGATVTFAGNPNPGVLPPNSHPYGHTYGEWSNTWWKWAFKTPRSNNPLLDTTGANCGVGQSGSVWFLAGTFGSNSAVRNCTIPTGKALFFPIANTEQDNVCPAASFTVDQLKARVKVVIDSFAQPNTQLDAKVDGVDIQQLQQNYQVGPSSSFSIILPQNNLYSLAPPNGCSTPAGTYSPAVSGGYYLMLAPLKPGTHTIHFNADNTKSSAPSDLQIQLDVTYYLTVK